MRKKRETEVKRRKEVKRVSRTRNTGIRLFPFKCRQQEWTSKRIPDEENLTKRSYQQEMRNFLGSEKRVACRKRSEEVTPGKTAGLSLCLWHPRETLSCLKIIFVFQKKAEKKKKQFMTVDDAFVTQEEDTILG